MKVIKLSLAENAGNFFNEALLNAINAEKNPIQWKFGILHLIQAIELSLKEFLRILEPDSIYQNVNKNKTITLEEAIEKLKEITPHALDEDELKNINTVAQLRHHIVHYKFELNPLQCKLRFSKCFSSLVDFYLKHLKVPIEKYVDKKIWIEAAKIEQYGEMLLGKAESQLEDFQRGKGTGGGEIEGKIDECPYCGSEAFLIPYEGHEGSCLVCKGTHPLEACNHCGDILLHRELDDPEDYERPLCVICRENHFLRYKDD